MKKYTILPIIFLLTIDCLYAEISVSISNMDKVVVTTDDNKNSDYIYVDKNSQIINSTIGTTVYINSKPKTQEEKNHYYQKKIQRYEEKIDRYRLKIENYQAKIIKKPKYSERYRARIDEYELKIEKFQEKIKEFQLEIK